jgi:hypothetical protein
MSKTVSKRFAELRDLVREGDIQSARICNVQLQKLDLPPAARELLDAFNRQYPHLSVTAVKPGDQLLSELDESCRLKDGISIVSCCMNRNYNLAKALTTWLQLDVDEIVIVDWSSSEAVIETLSNFDDERIVVIRVDDESSWILTYAFNVGLRFVSYSRVFKLDADICVSPEFLELNRFSEGEYVRGYWKQAVDNGMNDQKFVNGSFGAFKADLRRVGYYNEFIQSYGWDDTDLYQRLSCVGSLRATYLELNSLSHMEQGPTERLKHQSVSRNPLMDSFEATEFYNQRNRFIVALQEDWRPELLSDYVLRRESTNYYRARRISSDIPIPDHVVSDADRYAVRRLAGWIPFWGNALEQQPGLADLILDHYRARISPCLTRRIIESGGEIDVIFLEERDPPVNLQQYLVRIYGLAGVIASSRFDECFQIQHREQLLVLQPLDGPGQKLPSGFNTVNESARIDATFSSNMPCSEYKVLACSLYDEKNSHRLHEYLYCLERNVKIFDAIVIFYEKDDGLLLDQIFAKRIDADLLDKIIFVDIKKRPTFEYIYDSMDQLFPACTVFVSNADIAFGSTVELITTEVIGDSFFVLSRHEVDIESKKSQGLIMNQQGIPNTFSADTWIYRAPRRHRFKADFHIGSWQCDSYMNHYVSLSGYKAFNPCLDISIQHIHDPIFNSSNEKEILQQDAIQRKLDKETELNNGILPINGIQWCTLEDTADISKSNKTVNWTKTLLRIEMNADGSNLFQCVVSAIIGLKVLSHINYPTSVWVCVQHPILNMEVYRMLVTIQEILGDERFRIGVHNTVEALPLHSDLNVSCAEFLQTAEIVARGEPGRLWVDGHELKTEAGDSEIDDDPYLIANYIPSIDDILSYRLLKLLDPAQLSCCKRVFSFLRESGWSSLQPWLDDLVLTEGHFIKSAAPIPRVAFITSVFKGEEFMEGYLANIAIAAQESQGEVIIIDANSPENEQRQFEQFIQVHPEYVTLFRYIRLDHDPGLYGCWRIGIEATKAKYITNANLDDRRSPFQAVALMSELDRFPEYAGAASAIRATKARNSCWYQLTEDEYWFDKGFEESFGFSDLYIETDQGAIKSQNIMHCMPVWRKTLHEKYGYFDEERYGTSADWAFWLHCARAGEKFRLLPTVSSQYFINESSHNRTNDPNGVKERLIISDYLGVDQESFIQQ